MAVDWKQYSKDHPEFFYVDSARIDLSLNCNLDDNVIHRDPLAARQLLKNARQLSQDTEHLVDQQGRIVPGVLYFGGFAHQLQPAQNVVAAKVSFEAFTLAGSEPHPLCYRLDRVLPQTSVEGANIRTMTTLGRLRYHGTDHPSNASAQDAWLADILERSKLGASGMGYTDLPHPDNLSRERLCWQEGILETKQQGTYTVSEKPANMLRLRMEGVLPAELFTIDELIEHQPKRGWFGKTEPQTFVLNGYGRKHSGEYIFLNKNNCVVDGGKRLGETEFQASLLQVPITVTPEMIDAFMQSVDASDAYQASFRGKLHPLLLASIAVRPFMQYGTKELPTQPVGFTKKAILDSMKADKGEFMEPQLAFRGLSMLANTTISPEPQELSVVVALDEARALARRGQVQDGVEVKPYLHIEDMTLLFCVLGGDRQPLIGGKAYVNRTWPVKLNP